MMVQSNKISTCMWTCRHMFPRSSLPECSHFVNQTFPSHLSHMRLLTPNLETLEMASRSKPSTNGEDETEDTLDGHFCCLLLDA